MDKKSIEIAKKFASRIKKEIEAEKVILFGSRARGDNFQRSDFDFLIVSKKFSNIPVIFRMSILYDYWNEDIDMEAICYTPEEFKKRKNQLGIVRKAVSEGIEI